MGSTDTVVRLDDYRIADFIDEFTAVVKVINDMISGYRNPGLDVVFLHSGLELDLRHVRSLEAGSDVEIGTQLGVSFQPVFVV